VKYFIAPLYFNINCGDYLKPCSPISNPQTSMFDLCAIGNALVDIIVSTDDAFLHDNRVVKGAMTLVDEKSACALYEQAGPAVELSSGGSAANSLAGAASLGIKCAFLGKVGNDSFGKVFTHDLHAQNIQFATPPSPSMSTGRCLILVTPDAQRSMNTYLGAAVELGPNDVDADVVQQSAITYLEGYLFDKPLAQQAFGKAARLAHEAGRKVSMTLSDTFCARRHREAFLNLISRDVDILLANEGEVKELYETQDLTAALAVARTHADTVVVTRGEKGALIASSEHTFEIKAHPVVEVIDTTGAGDLFAAGFLYGLTCGKSLPECGRIGAIAASEIIGHYGPRPQKILKELI
jgi:sugar/nucleoside kinase (ribokinase family)